MKHKKLLFPLSLLLLISLIIALTTLIFKKNTPLTTLLGNPITTNINYDDTFSSSYMDCALLNKMITNDASKIKNEKTIKISKLLKNSSKILIHVGQVDLCNKIVFDEQKNEFIFQEDILNRQIQISVSYMKNILTQILSINKNTAIIIYKVDYPFKTQNDIIQSYFDCLNEYYFDLSSLNKLISFNK